MEETRIFARPFTRGPKDALFHEMVLFLRFVQQCCLVVTLFVAAYFVYWHIILVDDVPKGLVVMIGTVSRGGRLVAQITNHEAVCNHTPPSPNLNGFAHPLPARVRDCTTQECDYTTFHHFHGICQSLLSRRFAIGEGGRVVQANPRE